MPPTDVAASNRRELRKLELSIEAQPERLSLLLAVCDDRNLQAQLMEQYEAELREAGIATYRTRLSHNRPSLKAALLELVEQEPALRSGDPAVVTVLNAGELLGVRLTAEKSEQEKFFFSLQWTREALRQFNFPIVLWLPDEVATRLARQAPDFWSWRSGVFEFAAAPPDFTAAASPDGLQPLMMSEAADTTGTDSQIPIADLEQQIATLTKSSPESPLLITLHNTLGEAYEREYRYQDALAQYQQALTHAEAHQDATGEARSLRNLGDALKDCGRPSQAMPYYQKALVLYQKLENKVGEARSLGVIGEAYFLQGFYRQAIKYYEKYLKIVSELGNQREALIALGNLANAYESLGQYQKAIEFSQHTLNVAREIKEPQIEAYSLLYLGNLYFNFGQYSQAIDFYKQALQVSALIGNRRIQSNALGNLGNALFKLYEYRQAITFHQQSLTIEREMGDHRGEANSLGSLGLVYDALGQYQQAINFHQQSLEIKRDIGDRQGEANSLGNLGIAYYSLGQYQQAIDFYQQSLEIKRGIGDREGEARSLFNKANSLARLDDKWQARDCYQAAKEIYAELDLPKEVEECDVAIRDLGQQIVMEPKPAPAIGSPETAKPRRRFIPFWVWVVLVLVLVLLIGWWLL